MDAKSKKERKSKSLRRQAVPALIVFAVALSAFAPMSYARETVDSVAASVSGEIILYSEVRERWFQMNAMGQNSDAKATMKDALETLVDEKLVVLYGKEKEVKISSYELDQAVDEFRKRVVSQGADLNKMLEQSGLTMERYRNMLNDQLIARKVVNMEIRSEVHISEKDVQQYYDGHKELFTGRQKARASHILRFVPKAATDEDRAKSLAFISNVRKEIAEGMNFADAARKYSEDPSAINGGDLGEVVQGEMVEEFDKSVFSLKPGVVSEPVRTQFGYHLIKVQQKTNADIVPLEKVKGEIENRIFSDLLQSHKEEWIKRIRKNATIDIKLN